MVPVAILAGGVGTRLGSRTEKIPKALIAIAGKPFLYHQLDYLYEQGLRDVTLCVGYLGEMIEAHIGKGDRFGLKVTYSNDWPNLLGTGGALRKAGEKLGSVFFVLYGDTFLPINFLSIERAYTQSDRLGLMTIFKNVGEWDASNVLVREGGLIEYNKFQPRKDMMHIDYGLTIVDSSILDKYPYDFAFDLADVYRTLSLDDQLLGYEVYERFHEIGSPLGLMETESFFDKRLNL